jgi:hypothetical protein
VSNPKLTRIWSAVALLAGAVLRFWGIGFAPTAPRARPDEETFIPRAFEMFQSSRGVEILRTGFPEGFFRVYHYLMRLEAGVLHLLWGHRVNLACLYALNPGAVELPTRLLSAVADVLTCLLVGLMVTRLARKDQRYYALPLGILAYACNYLAVRDAHFGVADSTLVCCIALSLYFCLRAALDHPAFLLAAGAAAGAGFGLKYSAAPVAVPCVVATALALLRFKGRLRTLAFAVLAAAAAGVAFLAMSPTVASHYQDLLYSLHTHHFRYGPQARAHLLDMSWVPVEWWKFYLFEALPGSFGLVGLILAAGGLLFVCWRSPIAGLIFLSFVLGNLKMLFGIEMLFIRYIAPLIPVLAVGLGLLLVTAWGLLSELMPRRWGIPAFIVLLFASLGPPLWTSVQLDHLLARPDTRDAANRWLLKQGPQSRAVTQGWYSQVQLLDPASEQACAAEVPPWLNPGMPMMPEAGSRWPAAMDAGERGWAFIAQEAIDNYCFHSPGRETADFVAVGRIVLPCGKMGLLEQHPPLDPQCFQLVETVSPGEPSCNSTMDVFDIFLAPYTGFGGWSMAGPKVEIFKNLCKQ